MLAAFSSFFTPAGGATAVPTPADQEGNAAARKKKAMQDQNGVTGKFGIGANPNPGTSLFSGVF